MDLWQNLIASCKAAIAVREMRCLHALLPQEGSIDSDVSWLPSKLTLVARQWARCISVFIISLTLSHVRNEMRGIVREGEAGLLLYVPCGLAA